MKLEEKIKELIAVGAAVTGRCRPCLDYHSRKALRLGSDAEEITEAFEIGKRVRFVAEQAMLAIDDQATEAPSSGRCA